MARSTLATYRKKRDFSITPEPTGTIGKSGIGKAGADKSEVGRFVVHEHHATRLHFDLRLEMGGVLKSWAVPKGPSLDPKDRRLAIETEDHPIEYLTFQGSIADGQYGAGQVAIWDTGTYTLPPGEDPLRAWDQGKLHIDFHGEKLHGAFVLIRSPRGERQWLLFKRRDQDAETDWQPALILPYGARSEKPEGLSIPESALRKTESAKPKPTKPLRKQPTTAPSRNVWPEGAEVSAMPQFIQPMLATLADKPFDDPGWIFESKFDGWRALLRKEASVLQLISRTGKRLDAMFPELMSVQDSIGADACMLDGEIVALDRDGRPRFQLLQSRLKGKPGPEGEGPIVFYAFDLPFCAGRDLTACALLDRKALLRSILSDDGPVRYSAHEEERGQEAFANAVRLGFEGVMAKRKDSPYRNGRSADWLKIKSKRRQEMVITGYTAPRGSRAFFGSLVMGIYQDGELQFAGHVGGGFDAKLLREVMGFLEPLKTKASPFAQVPKTNEKVQWVRPEWVAEVEFTEWTGDGRLRQPIFMGLRPDKAPKDCVREGEQSVDDLRAITQATTQAGTKSGKSGAAPRSKTSSKTNSKTISKTEDVPINPVKIGNPGHEFEITHPDRVLWPGEGYTKRDLAEYYQAVAAFILPHLKDRPLILKRFPRGIDQPSFFQHDLRNPPAFVKTVPLKEEDGSDVNYVLCQNPETLLYLANLSVIPQNPWLSRASSLHRPDWIVFDLDPREAPFSEVCGLALYLKEILDGLGLQALVKTSGSAGIHIYLPLRPRYDFTQALSFARLFAAYAVRMKPDSLTTERSIPDRKRGLIYLDCMQNSYGKSVASAYSVRERPGACVSAPLEWVELKRKLRLEDFDIRSMPKRLEKKGDLFEAIFKIRNSLEAPFRKLEKRIQA